MSIVKKTATDDGFRWKFLILPRQFGDYRVCWEWVQYKTVGSTRPTDLFPRELTTWRDKDGNVLAEYEETLSPFS